MGVLVIVCELFRWILVIVIDESQCGEDQQCFGYGPVNETQML